MYLVFNELFLPYMGNAYALTFICYNIILPSWTQILLLISVVKKSSTFASCNWKLSYTLNALLGNCHDVMDFQYHQNSLSFQVASLRCDGGVALFLAFMKFLYKHWKLYIIKIMTTLEIKPTFEWNEIWIATLSIWKLLIWKFLAKCS